MKKVEAAQYVLEVIVGSTKVITVRYKGSFN